MSKFYSLLRKKRFYFSLLLIGGLLALYQASDLRYNDQSLMRKLAKNALELEAAVHHYSFEEHSMRYVEIGNDSLPLVLFVHGAPSSSAFWLGLLKDSSLLARAKLMAVDRLGYGYSDYGRPITSLKKQAAAIAKLLRQKRKVHFPIVVHGSSYGGSVATRLAIDFPDLVDGLLLQSASVAPDLETTYSISYPSSHWALEWLVPGALKVANAEKLSHADELRRMEDRWYRIDAHCIVLHGRRDRLIFPENASFAYERLRSAASAELVLVEDSGHDLLWTARPLLIESLHRLIDYNLIGAEQTLGIRSLSAE